MNTELPLLDAPFEPLQLARLEAYAVRVPVRNPIKVAFGTFRDRPMVLVRVIDVHGHEGWGEAWANWPAVGAEHRARLAADVGQRLIGRPLRHPGEGFTSLTREMEVLVLQTGEVGPMAQAIAGIDIALWDLAARRAGQPLNRFLGGPAVDSVPVYATGINPDQPEQFAVARQAEGHRAFKLKIGFGHDRDVGNLVAMRQALGPQAVLTCDANQTWGLEESLAFCRQVEGLNLQWLEEPMRIDAPAADWQALAQASTTPLAGGENLQGASLDDAVRGPVLQVLQPDVTKWGGITANWRAARSTVAAGKRYCPHYFGGGLSLLSSLHLLAAAGGTGLLEYDCHPNVGRESIVGDLLPVQDGRVPVPAGPGLGAQPDLQTLAPHITWSGS